LKDPARLYIRFDFAVVQSGGQDIYGDKTLSEGGVRKLAVPVGVDPYSFLHAEFLDQVQRTEKAIPVAPLPPPPPTAEEKLAQIKALGVSATIEDGHILVESAVL
jgi:hypothetical protein